MGKRIDDVDSLLQSLEDLKHLRKCLDSPSHDSFSCDPRAIYHSELLMMIAMNVEGEKVLVRQVKVKAPVTPHKEIVSYYNLYSC